MLNISKLLILITALVFMSGCGSDDRNQVDKNIGDDRQNQENHNDDSQNDDDKSNDDDADDTDDDKVIEPPVNNEVTLDLSQTYYAAVNKGSEWQQITQDSLTIKTGDEFVHVCKTQNDYEVDYSSFSHLPEDLDQLEGLTTTLCDQESEYTYIQIDNDQKTIDLFEQQIIKNSETNELELLVLAYDKTNQIGYFKKEVIDAQLLESTLPSKSVYFTQEDQVDVLPLTASDADRYNVFYAVKNRQELISLTPYASGIYLDLGPDDIAEGQYLEVFNFTSNGASYVRHTKTPGQGLEVNMPEYELNKENLTVDVNAATLSLNNPKIMIEGLDTATLLLSYDQYDRATNQSTYVHLSVDTHVNSDEASLVLPLINFSGLPNFPTQEINNLTHYQGSLNELYKDIGFTVRSYEGSQYRGLQFYPQRDIIAVD
ncbi:hypothetical protein HF888_01000 [Bermanella marisrubri]|uniref:Lipoprotein n=1 Tax=Bermanella marisrubri TaxID=207949 RepID=Q1N487_9GAMM|nr:hypothetical protein [Bermanella marisrubri]EAT12978.1 hypothetical protein RED65_14817 [Oceanobacter sp. RED65] [Bermanella marisrubri]QIZ82894.1 hypothetical protein HF888_01000 [Bermanella marisrubri]